MVVSGDLGYPELFTPIEALGQRLARTVSPTIYTPDELAQRIARGDAFVKRVLAQPKLWIIGGEAAVVYNAAHALCLAALRWHGYRSGNRYIVFQLVPHTLDLGPAVWRVLAKATSCATPANTKATSTSTLVSLPIRCRPATGWRPRFKL